MQSSSHDNCESLSSDPIIATNHAILPGSHYSILDGVKHGGSQEQRRFSYSLKAQIDQTLMTKRVKWRSARHELTTNIQPAWET